MPLTLEPNPHGSTGLHATDGSDFYWIGGHEQSLGFQQERQFVPWNQGDPMPTHIQVGVVQYSPNGVEANIELDALKLVRAVNGGIRQHAADKEGQSKVDCSSHTYALYLYTKYSELRPEVVVGVEHGCGTHFSQFRHCFAYETLTALAGTVTDGQFWDILDLLLKAYGHGKEHGTTATARKYSQAFVDGRLKKQRKGGMVRVEIVDAKLKRK